MKQDRRIQRTQQAIWEAFFSLLVEKGYENVSVQDIVERANIGRTTFYAHYSDKEDLLNNALNQLFLGLGNALELEGSKDITPARGLFEHVNSMEQLQQAFDFEVIAKKFHTEIVIIVKQKLLQRSTKKVDKQLLEMKAEVVSGGLIALLKWWLKEGKPYSADEMAATFHAMLSEGI